MACIFFTPFFIAVYIVERLVLQTIHVLNKEILQFLGQESAVYNRERFLIKSVRMYNILTETEETSCRNDVGELE